MLQLFKNNDFITNFLVLFYVAIFAANLWIYPTDNLEVIKSVPATISSYIMGYYTGLTFNKIAFVILLVLQAFYVNYLVAEYKLVRQYTLVPAVCYILLYFSYPSMDMFTPVLLANTFLLFSFHGILDSYDKKVSLGTIYNIGFWIAMASLFYASHWVYIIWGILALLIVRTFDLQEFVLLILGFFTPFFLAGTVHYGLGSYSFWQTNHLWVHFGATRFALAFNNQYYIMLAILVTPFLLSVLNLGGLQFKTTTKEKKFINVTLLLPVIGLLTFFFQNQIHVFHFMTFMVPVGILFGLVMQSYKNALFAEAVHFLIFMGCLGLQYQAFFFGS